jgi:uncharacterized Zn finger protein
MAYDDYYRHRFRDYVPVAMRRAQAALELKKHFKKGQAAAPVTIDGRKIAKTFWGQAWCENLERYSDFASRLPRGRTYVRNGSVVDLQIAPGVVTAFVSGSELYRVRIEIGTVDKNRWTAVCTDCAGAIDSVVELLQGRFAKNVMARICDPKTGLFPSPREITFTCSCPDWASMCKHVAAVLYGIGARLDERPELMFALRKVNQHDLVAHAGVGLTARSAATQTNVLHEDDLSSIFGIDIAPLDEPQPATATAPPAAKISAAPKNMNTARKRSGVTAAQRSARSTRTTESLPTSKKRERKKPR